jgi:hypothetical protein
MVFFVVFVAFVTFVTFVARSRGPVSAGSIRIRLTRRMPRLSGQIAAAAIAATVIGLLDAALVATGHLGAARAFEYVPARLWVLAPAVWLSMGAVACAVLLPWMRRWGGVAVTAALAATFAAIRLHDRAILLIAAFAVLVVLLAIAGRWMLRWMAKPRRAIAAGVAGVVSMSALVAFAHPRTVTPAAARSAGPNVILIFLDTVRYDAVFDANGRIRDGLTSLARLRAGSTAFTRAYSTTSWTLPSHLSAVTGLPAHQIGVSFDVQVYRRSDRTLAERFQARGYRTAAVISNSFLNEGTGFERGFETFEQAKAGLDLCRTAPGLVGDTYWPWFSAAVCNWTASDVTRRALALMDDRDGPFFLTLNYMDAHDPYYVERFCREPDGYAAAVRCLDRSLAPIVDWQSPRRPTVLAVVGDHGEQFGEHGLVQHGNSLYVQLLHVPLIVRPAGAARREQKRRRSRLPRCPRSSIPRRPAGPPRGRRRRPAIRSWRCSIRPRRRTCRLSGAPSTARGT